LPYYPGGCGRQDRDDDRSENGVNRKTVRLWRDRYRSGGPPALWEVAPGRGRKPRYDVTRIKAVIDATLQTKPKGSTHWSCRTMAAAQGISKGSVSRIWRSHNIKPHRTETFKLSRDPKFLEAASRDPARGNNAGAIDARVSFMAPPNYLISRISFSLVLEA